MANILNNFEWSYLYQRAISLVAALLCIIIHEISHGFVSYKLGDNTAKSMGRLTLNPIKHIDLFGLLAFVFFGFGWAKPVQIDPRNFKRPKRDMAITALAGPVSNFVLAVFMLFLLGVLFPFIKTSIAGQIILDIVYLTAAFSVTLGIFNLIPVPPLDGSKVLFSVASDELYGKLLRFERFGYIFLLLVLFINYRSNFIGVASNAVMNHLASVTQFSYHLVTAIFGS